MEVPLHHRFHAGFEAHPAWYPVDTKGSFTGGKGDRSVKQTTHLHLVPRLGVPGNLPPHPLVCLLSALFRLLMQMAMPLWSLSTSKKQDSSWRADSRSASLGISRLSSGPRFRNRFRNCSHRSPSWARWIRSTPSYHVSPWSILILSSHQLLDLPSRLPFRFSDQNFTSVSCGWCIEFVILKWCGGGLILWFELQHLLVGCGNLNAKPH